MWKRFEMPQNVPPYSISAPHAVTAKAIDAIMAMTTRFFMATLLFG
jgi:hypothetical protein